MGGSTGDVEGWQFEGAQCPLFIQETPKDFTESGELEALRQTHNVVMSWAHLGEGEEIGLVVRNRNTGTGIPDDREGSVLGHRVTKFCWRLKNGVEGLSGGETGHVGGDVADVVGAGKLAICLDVLAATQPALVMMRGTVQRRIATVARGERVATETLMRRGPRTRRGVGTSSGSR